MPEPPSWRCGCGQPWPCLALAEEIETEHRRDPEWTEQTLGRLLPQAAADIGVPPDALRHRFLPWSTDPARDCRHQLDRYRWDCAQCAAPWPCPPARVELTEAYVGDPLGLAELMGRLLAEATPVTGLPGAELTERFTGWVERWLAVPVDPLLLSPAGLHRWLVAQARTAVLAHWPDTDDACQLCRTPHCWTLRAAATYLANTATEIG
nr:hypothetical protein [Micromonospora sp. DSM 115978]